ncbi:MAG: hypothetical protein BMS9Abin05_2686 [Rhodothermia bacterium]|nr:MAG: hypothetical protein BMS9Abin05_2686 [Rhodothermia bacterium]
MKSDLGLKPIRFAGPLQAGFSVARTKGAHHILRHADGRTTVVPVHSGEVIRPTLLTKILRDCDLTREEFEELL